MGSFLLPYTRCKTSAFRHVNSSGSVSTYLHPAVQTAYPNLSVLLFNALNQTKSSHFLFMAAIFLTVLCTSHFQCPISLHSRSQKADFEADGSSRAHVARCSVPHSQVSAAVDMHVRQMGHNSAQIHNARRSCTYRDVMHIMLRSVHQPPYVCQHPASCIHHTSSFDTWPKLPNLPPCNPLTRTFNPCLNPTAPCSPHSCNMQMPPTPSADPALHPLSQ